MPVEPPVANVVAPAAGATARIAAATVPAIRVLGESRIISLLLVRFESYEVGESLVGAV